MSPKSTSLVYPVLALLAVIGIIALLIMNAPQKHLQGTSSQAPVSIASPDTHTTTLPNGLTLIVLPDSSHPVVSVQGWVRTGSIHEDEFLGAGISHLLEHMLFKGTENRGIGEIAQTLQAQGGYVNAYTSFDRTVYYADLPSTGWKVALDVLVDAVFRSTLPKEEFDKEREVIRREFAMGQDSPEKELQKLLFRTAFRKHPYQYPIIGYLDLFNNLTYEDLQQYYRERYIPSNTAFIVVGDVDPKAVEEEFIRLAGDLPRQSLEPVFIPDEPRQIGKREAHETFPTDAPRAYLAFHIPSITHPDLYALDLLATIAGHGESSRLHKEFVEKRQWARSIHAFSYTPAESGLWAVSTTLLPGHEIDRAQLQADILKLLQDFAVHPPSPAEFAKAKRQALTQRAAELKTVAGKASSIGSSYFVAGDVNFDDNYLRNLQSVTDEDIIRVVQKYFTEDNLSFVTLTPPGSGDKEAEKEKEDKDAPSTGIETGKLSNGVPVVMVQNRSVPLVSIRILGTGGLLAETAQNSGIGMLTTRVLDKGTPTRTAEQIAEEIDSLGGNLGYEFGNNSFSVALEVLEPDLPVAVELLADIMLRPTFPEEEIIKERKLMLADLALEKDQPISLARNAMRELIFGTHPYAFNRLGTAGNLESFKRSEIADFHQKRMVAENLVFSLGGSFDKQTALDLLNQHFADLPKGEKPNLPGEPRFPDKPIYKEIPSPKQQAIVQIAYPGIALDNPDRAELEVIDEALSDMASRLFLRIREKQSLAYFVGTSQMIGLEKGYFFFYAGTAPETSEKATSEILDEIRILTEEGLTEDEVRRASVKLLGQRLLHDQSASIVAFRAALNELYGLPVDFEETLNEQIRTIKTEEVNAVLKRTFSTPNHVIVIVQPGSDS